MTMGERALPRGQSTVHHFPPLSSTALDSTTLGARLGGRGLRSKRQGPRREASTAAHFSHPVPLCSSNNFSLRRSLSLSRCLHLFHTKTHTHEHTRAHTHTHARTYTHTSLLPSPPSSRSRPFSFDRFHCTIYISATLFSHVLLPPSLNTTALHESSSCPLLSRCCASLQGDEGTSSFVIPPIELDAEGYPPPLNILATIAMSITVLSTAC